ncbi:MAG TPA: preprotein translocase subunit SecE [Cyclobacteriaceae bacterium]|jgi:preprotein translocase subunit SecE|nr:preprotein translocase subunit SecE [Cyclobacteriaceae bacterium]
MSKTTEYLKEVQAEAKHITWPTRNQTIFYTIAVLIISAGIAYFLGLFDAIFSKGLEWLITR